MKHFWKICFSVCILLLLMLVGLFIWLGQREAPQAITHTGYYSLENAKGFLVSMGEQGEFPTQSGLSVEEQKIELDQMITFAKEYGLNTIFYQALAGQEAWYRSQIYPFAKEIAAQNSFFHSFDPLEYLVVEAAKHGVQVFALVDAEAAGGIEHSDQVGATIAELAGRYGLAGVILDIEGMDIQPREVKDLCYQARLELENIASEVELGLLFDGQGTISPQEISILTQEEVLQLVLPRLDMSVDDPKTPYTLELEKWASALQGEQTRLYPVTTLSAAGEGTEEVSYRLFINSLSPSVSGVLLDSYAHLRQDPEEAGVLLSCLASVDSQLPSLELTIPQTLAVTYPNGNITTTDRSIFIMGTSDPVQTLTLDGQPLERISKGGTFGVKVDLKLGANSFTFSQGTEKATVTITRRSPASVSTITQITKTTLFPQYDLGVDSNETLEISCTGPAGGSITAVVGGVKVPLRQTAAAAQDGVAARYQGSFTLNPSDYPPDKTTNLGPITYYLTYKGATTTYRSEGDVIVAGQSIPLTLEVTSYMASVLEDGNNDDTIIGTLKAGARAAVIGRMTTTRSGALTFAYQLADGGWILAEKVKILDGSDSARSKITDFRQETAGEQGEYLIFGGGTPAVITHREENMLILDFLDTDFSADLSTLESPFVEESKVEETSSGARLRLILNPEQSLWGYNLEYDSQIGDTRLYLRRPPVRNSSGTKPLHGVTILLDAGHGGSDPGALGVAGSTGPVESEINLAAIYAVKYRLKQLGATAILTRADDSRVSLDERCILSEELKPDIFLSIHHNSAALTGDLNETRRMEVYYHEDISFPLANSLMKSLSATLKREATDPEESYYYVTRMTYTPSVLFELGYIVNPREYEEACDTINLYKTACGIAQAILDIIPQNSI